MKAEKITYFLERSRRKTISLRIGEDGSLLVRAPQWSSRREIEAFIEEKKDWIEKTRSEVLSEREKAKDQGFLTDREIRALAQKALKVIPERVAYYAPLVGVTYGRITIRNQRTRWGSCTAEGNLNFNCLLMLAPPEVLDSVVVHELCHRLEMNHSRRFYAEVHRVFPDYDRAHAWLKKEGRVLMERMKGGT